MSACNQCGDVLKSICTFSAAHADQLAINTVHKFLGCPQTGANDVLHLSTGVTDQLLKPARKCWFRCNAAEHPSVAYCAHQRVLQQVKPMAIFCQAGDTRNGVRPMLVGGPTLCQWNGGLAHGVNERNTRRRIAAARLGEQLHTVRCQSQPRLTRIITQCTSIPNGKRTTQRRVNSSLNFHFRLAIGHLSRQINRPHGVRSNDRADRVHAHGSLLIVFGNPPPFRQSQLWAKGARHLHKESIDGGNRHPVQRVDHFAQHG